VENYQDIRDGVTALCTKFPGEYWQKLDARSDYPDQFGAELTASGYLAALIPEEFGGSGLGVAAAGVILEEISRSGGHRYDIDQDVRPARGRQVHRQRPENMDQPRRTFGSAAITGPYDAKRATSGVHLSFVIAGGLHRYARSNTGESLGS